MALSRNHTIETRIQLDFELFTSHSPGISCFISEALDMIYKKRKKNPQKIIKKEFILI
jgi:hypothetical protein